MTDITIEKGDIVSVDINGAQITVFHRAEVIHLPQATGDSWIFKGIEGTGKGQLTYISEGCTITKILKAGV